MSQDPLSCVAALRFLSILALLACTAWLGVLGPMAPCPPSSLSAAPLPSAAAPLRRGSAQLSSSCDYPARAADLNLSYPLPAYWPLPALPMVMESIPRACDLCWTRLGDHPNPCELLSSKQLWTPDPHVREALVSALGHCVYAPGTCRFLDLGANMGVFSLWGWALGARVLAVEPQPDLSRALARTAALNCAGGELEVLAAGVTAASGRAGEEFYRGPAAGTTKISILASGAGEANYAYRQCQLPSHLEPTIFHTVTDGEVPLVLLDDLLLGREGEGGSGGGGSGGVPHWDLIKVDIDGYDTDLLVKILTLVKENRVAVDTVIIEWNNCNDESHACGSIFTMAHDLG